MLMTYVKFYTDIIIQLKRDLISHLYHNMLSSELFFMSVYLENVSDLKMSLTLF